MGNKKSKKASQEWRGGLLNLLNKVSLVIDRNIPEMVMKSLEQCIVKLKAMPEYGINPVL